MTINASTKWKTLPPLRLLKEVLSVKAIPEKIANLLDCEDCVVWKPSKRLTPGEPLEEPLEQWRLYPWTSTFATQQAEHSGLALEFKNDTTGRIYKEYWEDDFKGLPETRRIQNDFPSEDAESISRQFMEQRGLKKIAVSFFHLREGDAPYAVSFYRNARSHDFCVDDVRLADACAECIPILIERFSGKNLRRLLGQVHRLLDQDFDGADIGETPKQLCDTLSEQLHCVETTIVLSSTFVGPEEFTIKATTLTPPPDESVFRAEKKDGLTGYVLETKETLEFHDLRNFHDTTMGVRIRQRYKGITWNDSASIIEHARSVIEPNSGVEQLPPIAFLGVPVIDRRDDQILGMIRCSLGTGPYFFIHAEREVLELIANSLGRWWGDRLRVIDEADRANLFMGLLNVQGRLQDSIRSAIDKDEVRDEIPHDAIDGIVEAFEGISLVAFRRLDQEKKLLLIESIGVSRSVKSTAKNGDAVELDSCGLICDLLNNASTPPTWIPSTKVSAFGSTFEVDFYSGLAGTYAVGITLEGQAIGVIDFGWEYDFTESPHAEQICRVMESLAKQLALYEQLEAYQKKLKKSVDDQIVMTQSVGHQIKSPLANARDTLDLLRGPYLSARRDKDAALELPYRVERLAKKHLPRVYGMVRKAQSVGRFMEIYGKLSREQALNLPRQQIALRDLKRLILEIYQNNIDHNSDRVKPAGFSGLFVDTESSTQDMSSNSVSYSVICNQDAIEQVLDAVIGNARKYGALRSAIEFRARFLAEKHALQIDIVNLATANKHLTELEARQCFEEGYRSPKMSGMLGSGLGLWIASELLLDQGGDIEAIPTFDSLTTFRLTLPGKMHGAT
ncbi:GAF domain-containing sensor histidine kinase [Roseiconus lacunae]|uniref:GAF domain-containing sensor histidine kinase n=1 Tax=Roseiconus lacunae TaxID=2605694 RepID=UPI001E2904FF|nr:GAF domain-containing protein [Roseiconus lacunae]MCD0461402.1 hypothetical protein [Roseiconus lacunae]